MYVNEHNNIVSAIAILESIWPCTQRSTIKMLKGALTYDDISMLVEAKRQLRILYVSGRDLEVVNGILTLLRS